MEELAEFRIAAEAFLNTAPASDLVTYDEPDDQGRDGHDDEL